MITNAKQYLMMKIKQINENNNTNDRKKMMVDFRRVAEWQKFETSSFHFSYTCRSVLYLNLLHTSAHLIVDLDFIVQPYFNLYLSHPGIHSTTMTFMVLSFKFNWIFDSLNL